MDGLDIKGLEKLAARVEREIHRRDLSEVHRLEQEANAIRQAIGYRRRPALAKETKVGR